MPEAARSAPPSPPRREIVPLLVLLGAAAWAFQRSYPAAVLWPFLLPAPVALVWRAPRLPRLMVVALERLSWAVLTLVVVFAVAWVLYPVFPPALVERLPMALGQALALLAAVFAAGGGNWAPPRALLPSALGLMMVGHLPPLPEPPWPAAVVGALAVVAWLLTASRTIAAKADMRAGLLRTGLFLAGSGLLAIGLVRLLPWAQPHVERTAAQMLTSDSQPSSGLSLESRLGEAEELTLSRRTVLRVWSARPQKLRARVLTRFDGRAWHPPAASLPRELPPAEAGAQQWLPEVPGRLFRTPTDVATSAQATIASKIVAAAPPPPGLLPSPAGVLLVRTRVWPLKMDGSGVLQPPPWPPIEAYGTVNGLGAQTGSAVGDFLQVPEPVDPRMKAAAGLLAQAPSPSERVRATVEFVERQCRYSLRVGRFRSRDPVAEFLFEKKQGYCEYFASAAALLLRLQGVPTRYVTGYHLDEGNRLSGHYVVREADAHAWIEAYVEGTGWVEVDPTPAAEYVAIQAAMRGGTSDRVMDWVRAAWAELMLRVRERDWRAGLALLLPVAVVFAAPRVWRRWRRVRWSGRTRGRRARDLAGVPPELAALLARLDRAWARRGSPRPPHRTPLEHLELQAEGEAPFLAWSRRVVDCFYRARYGGVRPGEVELAELGRTTLA